MNALPFFFPLLETLDEIETYDIFGRNTIFAKNGPSTNRDEDFDGKISKLFVFGKVVLWMASFPTLAK